MSARGSALAAHRRGWFAFTLPAAAWMAQLLLLYLLVPVACERGRAPLVALTAVALLAALGALAVARLPRHRRLRTEGAGDIAGVARIQGGVFVFAIAMTGVATLWIDPCA